MRKLMLFIGGLTCATTAPSASSSPVTATPAGLTALLDCQKLLDQRARLACFDATSSRLSKALGSHELMVVDREAVRSAKRSLFGFSIPSFGMFGGDKEEVKQLDGILSFASRNRDGGYVLGLQDGSQWTQIDDRPLALEPRRGDKIVVHRAALGSFMLNVGRMPGIRVKRLN